MWIFGGKKKETPEEKTETLKTNQFLNLKKKKKKMKEYKVVTLKLGFRNRTQNFEDLLNQYAREGWTLKEVPTNWNSIILERDKNR